MADQDQLPQPFVSVADWMSKHIIDATSPPCYTKHAASFFCFFEVFMENQNLHGLREQFSNLLRSQNFTMAVNNDLFFYVVLLNLILPRGDSSYHNIIMTESGNDLIEIVVQRLISIPTKQFLDEEIKPLFDYMRSTKGTINYFEAVYCDAFMGICDRWLNNCGRSGRSPPPLRYIYVAIVCVTLSTWIFCWSKVSRDFKKTSRWWTQLLIEPSKNIVMNEDALGDLSDGLQFMLNSGVPHQHRITLENLQAMVSTGPNGRVRSLLEAKCFLKTITSYCQRDEWDSDDFRVCFLKPLRRVYKDRQRGFKIKFWRKGGINELDGTVDSIIETGLQFITAVVVLLEGRIFEPSSSSYDRECVKWIDILLKRVDYGDKSAPKCIRLLTDTQSRVFQKFKEKITAKLNSSLQNCLKSIVDMNSFMDIFDSASDIWEIQVFEKYITNMQVKLFENSNLSDNEWKRFIQQFEKSYKSEVGQQHRLLLLLIRNFAEQYQRKKQAFSLIIDLLQLDTPCLFVPATALHNVPHDEFKNFLRNFIRLNNLQITCLSEAEVLLDNASLFHNQFHVLIVEVIIKEVFLMHKFELSSHTISAVLSVLQLTDDSDNKCLDMKSARIRFASGLLCRLSVHIHPSSDDLMWLFENTSDVLRIAQIHQQISKIECFKLVALEENENNLQVFSTSYPPEMVVFLKCVICIKKALRVWSHHLKLKQVIIKDIVNLQMFFSDVNDIASCLLVSEISLTEAEAIGNKKELDVVVNNLESVLVRHIPDLSNTERCRLSDLLEKQDIGFDEEIRDLVQNLVEISTNLVENNVEVSTKEITFIAKSNAHFNDLVSLLELIEKYLEPLQPCLEILVFFELHHSKLFECYLKSNLLLLKSPAVDARKRLNDAVMLTVKLIWKLCDGSATVQEVTLNDTLSLEDIDVEKEHSNLSLFAGIFSPEQINCSGLDGVTAVLKLLKIYEEVFTIRQVCEQFKLTECLDDPDLKCLVTVAEDLQCNDRRAGLTMDEAITKMKIFSDKLLLDKHGESILQLFKEVKDCKALFQFVEESGFVGREGRIKFIQSHNLVTTQLQHEEYNAVVLNHLLGCFDYIDPFLRRSSSFSELMKLVTDLQNVQNGIRQLRTVNMNIGLIKMWFQGESFENTAKTLKNIIKTRAIFLRASGTDPVKLTLECDPEKFKRLSGTTVEQSWSCEKLKEFTTQVKFMQHEMPKQDTNQRILKARDIDSFLEIFSKAQELQKILQELRVLQIRCESVLNIEINCSFTYQMTIEKQVIDAQTELDAWLKDTKKHRQNCKWLVFFSNRRLLQLHHYIVNQPHQHIDYLVREISVFFPNDHSTRTSLAKFIERAVEDLAENLVSLPAIENAEVFLNKLMEYNESDAPQHLMLVKQCTQSRKEIVASGPVRLRHFTLHYIPGFTHRQHIQLLFDILKTLPLPFQLLHCTANTTAEELELFFQRMGFFPEHKYIVLNTSLLSSDIQEMLLKMCLEMLENAANSGTVMVPMLHFTETHHSFLMQMPWILVNEHKDKDALPKAVCIRDWLQPMRDKIKFKHFELVYGNAGDGKTHYIKKKLKYKESMTLSVNECFNPIQVIEMLRNLPLKRQNCALFLNFTLPKPEKKASKVSGKQQHYGDKQEEENEQFWKLASEIHWFLFSLFVLGHIEDQSTGFAFRFPGGLNWSIFVEVPAWHDDAKKSLAKFNSAFPAFHYLGEEVYIAPTIPFDIDSDVDVQLVCKYFKARQEGSLDQWKHRGNRNRMPYLIGKIMPDMKDIECQKLLQNCLPTNITTRPKIFQRLYMKYLERRCRILEACPALQFNEGKGEPLMDKAGRPTGEYTNIKHIRSLLFKTMEKEVANFCDRNPEKSHQQLVYDGAASFKFLSLQPDKISREERDKFEECGIEIPAIKKHYSRIFLDSCLSHALSLPLNDEGRIALIDEKQYVMTLDYLVKMLNIHERRKCGIPVIINGETGVGKTFLIEMLSLLWNQSLLAALNRERCVLKDILITRLQTIASQQATGCGRKLSAKDMDEVGNVLAALSNMDSKKDISFDSLLHVLNLPDPQKPSNLLYKVFSSFLLEKRYKPLFSLIVFPDNMPVPNDSDIIRLFKQVNSNLRGDVHSATARLLYGLFVGQPRKTFHKLCIHAALTTEKIKIFFEDVISEAEKVLQWHNFSQCSDNDSFLSITIFLDEVNTASCPGFIKEIIIDRTMNAKEIPKNIFIVAACNPHRANSLAGQALSRLQPAQWFAGSYYVRPFHQTLQMLMWNYGSLRTAQENEYIDTKMMMIEPEMEPNRCTFLSKLISMSQRLVRDYAAQHLQHHSNHPIEMVKVMSKSTVSQRDIQRVFILYKWLKKSFMILGKYYDDMNDETQMLSIKLRALFVALAVVYYFRLNNEYRKKFSDELEQAGPPSHWKTSARFKAALADELDWTINNMTLSPGIAKTEALKENVYATVVCTMTRIPLIIVGQPGSSKTLSFKIVSMNLLGQESPNAVFRTCEVFKALDPHFYQCSRNSSSVEIEIVFQRAIDRQASLHELSGNKLSVVMMDEAGLPERSHESLKVLHYYLDDQKVAFVGISNHILDAAKMNRAVTLFRPEICQQDVEVLAKGCLLKDTSYVKGFSHSYLDVMRDASIQVNTFFGLRDFIHFCAYLRRSEKPISPELVIRSLERNFNGSNHFGVMSRYFLERVFQIGASTDEVKQRGVLEVLEESLADHPEDLSAENEVRYKLIIDSSEDGSLVRLLFSFGVLERKNTRIHVSSKFRGDAESEKLGVVAAIKHSASQGHTVVLTQTDTVHECFYDLFNQRFVCIEDSTQGKRFYANIAIGSYVKPCPVHSNFQCVIIIKESDLPYTPAAFLNRFEKYSLSHQILLDDVLKHLTPVLRELVTTAMDKVSQFLRCCGDSCLYGQNQVTLHSLLLSILPLYLPKTDPESQNCYKGVKQSKDKAVKLLAYLEWGLQCRLGFKFTPSSVTELQADGAHFVQTNKSVYAGQLEYLSDASIPDVVDKALVSFKQNQKLEISANTELIKGILQQWLITHLCKRLLQLMTPEALVTSHEKLPNHYISHYLNQQSHFSLKEVVVKYHGNLSQEWNPNGTSPVPNKLLCYCRSSDRLHGKSDEITDEFLQEFVFPNAEKLHIFKMTNLTSQKKISRQIQNFNQRTYEEVLLLVVNVEDVSLDTINHIRIMIEEFEATKLELSVPKLYVLLLHFPPRLFFSHFYSSYFLYGWDHYYLDTIGPVSSASINIQKWFRQCCAEPDAVVAPGSFMEADYLKNLLSEALHVVAPHVSLNEGPATASRIKMDYFKNLLYERGMDKIIFASFSSYWTSSVMIAISEQAANLARLLQSTLSITDAVNTIVKSNFYDFLFYILSLMNECQAIIIVFESGFKSPIEGLALSLVSKYPIPGNLPELKKQSIEIGKHANQLETVQPKFNFPFFRFVYDLIEELLNQQRREQISNKKLNDSSDLKSDLKTTQITQKKIYKTLVDDLEKVFNITDEAAGNREQQCLNAVFTAMESIDVWKAYVKDFCTTKLNLGSELFAKSMEETLTASSESNIRRRVADLHVCVRLHHLDSESLSLMRVLDELQIRYQAIPEEQYQIGLFEEPQKLFAVVIEATYNVLLTMSTNLELYHPECVSELKRLSSSYLQLMRMPTIEGTTVCKSIAVKTKWDIIHATMLMLNTEEILTERSAQHVLDFFKYLLIKCKLIDWDKAESIPKPISPTSPCHAPSLTTTDIPVLSLGKLVEYSRDHWPKRSKKQFLEGLLEHFFPPRVEVAYNEEDVSWFLNQLMISDETIFSRQPATIRRLKLYLTRILTIKCVSLDSSDLVTSVQLFNDKARESVAKVLLEFSTYQNGPFIPDFYMQCDAVITPRNSCLPSQLAQLYFSIYLELVRQEEMNLSSLIDLIKTNSQQLANMSNSPLDCVLLAIENQVLIHILLETLACELRLENEELSQLIMLISDINEILNDPKTGGGIDGGHGLMLTIHMFRRSRSIYVIHRLLVTHYKDLCRDYSCLQSLNIELSQQQKAEVKNKGRHKTLQNDNFPFKLIYNKKCKEGSLYARIKTDLHFIHVKETIKFMDKFMETVESCYTVGPDTSQKYMFNFSLLLCVYYEYFCQNKCSKQLANFFETRLKHTLDKGLLNLLKCFVDRSSMQYHPEETAYAQEAIDPLYVFFTQSFKDTSEDIDPDKLAMQHTLVHLVAAVVGSPIEYTNLWYHMFTPIHLAGSYIPGFNSNAACGVTQSEVPYDVATKLSDDGFNLKHKHLLHTTRGTLNIYSRYFILWANYSSLCLSLLMIGDQESFREKMFSSLLPLRHYCLSRASETWQLLSRNMNITVEERVQFVNQSIEHYYKKSRTNSICLKGTYGTQQKVDEYETFIHGECFAPAWRTVRQKHTEIYSALSTHYSQDLRVLDTHYPEFASKKSFLLQILSSTMLHDSTNSLYVLYQFVLRRPLFNAGGRLLPDLIDFYKWLHEEMTYCVTEDNAQKLSIGVAISTVLNSYSPAMRDRRHEQFNRVKSLYNSYDGRVGENLVDSTKLIELLSVADEKLKRGNILYNTIIKIVEDFNSFLESVVSHDSLHLMWRYFFNYKSVIPLDEVTVDACCFGDCLSLEDFSNLMPLISKCCNLERSTSAASTPCDPSLFTSCVPQVYDLLQLQEDVAVQFLAGKQLLQNPSKIYCAFHFKTSAPMISISDAYLCSATDIRSLENLHSHFKVDLKPEDLKELKYECHSFSYYTLLEVIIGLTSALNQLQRVLREYADSERMDFVDKMLAEFLNFPDKTLSPKEVLKVIGISRFSQSNADVSTLRDSQYDCLKNLKMKHVFKTLKLLTNWMREGRFDFCILPFNLKADMEDEDRDILCSIKEKAEGKAVTVLGEIKFVTERLIQCERNFTSGANIEAEPIMDILRKTTELTDEQKECLVIQHISSGVKVQHYVHLRLELRRLQEVIRNAVVKEKGSEIEASWSDWVAKDDDKVKDMVDTKPTHGFDKWYETSKETELARQAAQHSEDNSEEAVVESEQEKWTPPATMVKTHRSTVVGNLPCSLPSSESEDCQELQEKGSQYTGLVQFLNGMDLSEVAENVVDCGFKGDIITESDEVLVGIGMDAIARLRFRVLFKRELLRKTSPVAVLFPVEKVVAFFRENHAILAKYAATIEENSIDGEMLLLADGNVFEQLGITAAEKRVIKEKFSKLVLEKLEQ